jgi:hypothetical protein
MAFVLAGNRLIGLVNRKPKSSRRSSLAANLMTKKEARTRDRRIRLALTLVWLLFLAVVPSTVQGGTWVSKSSPPDPGYGGLGEAVIGTGQEWQGHRACKLRKQSFQLTYRKSIALDPYSPTFEMTPRYSGYYDYSGGIHWVSMPVDSNANMANHWTKRDDPQFSIT